MKNALPLHHRQQIHRLHYTYLHKSIQLFYITPDDAAIQAQIFVYFAKCLTKSPQKIIILSILF
jgi:hypothetical protein